MTERLTHRDVSRDSVTLVPALFPSLTYMTLTIARKTVKPKTGNVYVFTESPRGSALS